MDIATILAVGIPLLSWGIWISWNVAKIMFRVTRLLDMHEHADDYGFGTERTNKLIEDNTKAMNALVHYITWSIEHTTGQKPPPPLPR